MLTDALHARTGGDLGAASLPRHLRRRATSHNPYRGSTKHRPNAKRRRALDAAGLAPADVASRVGSATGAGAFDAGISPAAVSRASREAMAALLAGPAFDADSEQATGRVLTWIRSLLESGRASAAAVARRALRYHLGANPRLAHTALDACYSAQEPQPSERVHSSRGSSTNLKGFGWSKVEMSGLPPPKRSNHVMLPGGGGKTVLVFGGFDGNGFLGDLTQAVLE